MTLALATEAPPFDLPGVDGDDHSLDDYADAPALAVVWSCNHCPYVLAWEGRMNAIQRDYAERGFRLVAISSNDAERYPADSFEAMKQHAAEAGLQLRLPLRRGSVGRAGATGRSGRPRCSSSTPTGGSSTTARSTTRATRAPCPSTTCARRSTPCSTAASPQTSETPPVGCSIKWQERLTSRYQPIVGGVGLAGRERAGPLARVALAAGEVEVGLERASLASRPRRAAGRGRSRRRAPRMSVSGSSARVAGVARPLEAVELERRRAGRSGRSDPRRRCVPPGRVTRASSATASSGRGTWWSVRSEPARSNSPSAEGQGGRVALRRS